MAAPFFSSCIIRLNSSTEDKGIEVSVNYANFLSLEMERVWGDSANKFTLKLLDDTAYEVEGILLGGSRSIYLKYYVNDGVHSNYSKEFTGNIWDYSVDFVNNKVILTITGTCGVGIKDMYDAYNRLWNKVPTIKGEDFTEYQLKEIGATLFWRSPEDESYVDIAFRDAVNENGESSFQVSFRKDTMDNKRIWYDCTMINLPVRPSDIIKALIYGGSLYNRFSPEKNKDIDYDKFADAGFNFGTDNSGNTITYSMAQNYKKKNGNDSTGTPNIYQNYYQSVQATWDENTGMDKQDINLLKAAVSCELINEYLIHTEIDPCGWEYGKIVDTEPICADLSQVKMSDTKYINDVLINKSISSVGSDQVKANYRLYFDKDNKLHYEPAEIKANPKAKATFGQYLNPKAGKNTDTSGYGNDMIVSFSYTSNIAAYIAGESSSEFAGINYTTGESLELSGLSSSSQEKLGLKEGAYSAFTIGKMNVLSGESSTNIDVLLAKAQRDWVSIAQTSFKAEIQILGNLDLECGDNIEIINLPGGKMGKHHTSGVYLIMKIKENISKGVYLSTLTLVKNAASAGSGVSSQNSSDMEKGKIVVGAGSSTVTTSASGGGGGSSFGGSSGSASFDKTTSETGSSGGGHTSSGKHDNESKTSTVVKEATKVAAVSTAMTIASPTVVTAVALGVKALVNGVKKLFK